ncbi:MAG: hypothetical protein AB2A00_10820 [Myxococcota bacterium]
MGRGGAVILAVCLVGSACIDNPVAGRADDEERNRSTSSGGDNASGGGGSGSTSGGSGSGSGSGSSGLVIEGQPIPLEQLCPVLANGYVRSFTYYLYGISFGTGAGCEPAISDEDLLTMTWGDVNLTRAGLCALDGGLMTENVSAVAQGEAAGRLTYDEEAAGDCLAVGRQYFANNGGLVGSLASTARNGFDAAGYETTACAEILVGHQAEGQPCNSTAECQRGDGGAACVHRLSAGCEGVCQHLGWEGEECETRGNPPCSGNLSCIKPGDGTTGRCAPPAQRNQRCEVDGGTVACVEGTVCVSGTCIDRLPEGTACTTSEECQAGLSCSGTPSRCQSPAALGEVCANGSVTRPCQPCLACAFPPGTPDGGEARCTEFAKLGQSCAANPCTFGLVCINQVCAPLARTGEACSDIDLVDVDDTQRGNCLNPLDACQGAPRTCQPRVPEGQACVAPPTSRPVQGNCAGGLICARESGVAVNGVCRAAPDESGERCGMRPDLHPSCSSTGADAASLQCSRTEDGGEGVCVASSNGQVDDLCVQSYACRAGHYCAGVNEDAGTPGQCRRGGALGQPCGYETEWEYTCQEGFCGYTGPDGGYTYVCQPYRGLGEACSYEECGPLYRCLEGVCAERIPVGSPCTGYSDCVPGAVCSDEGVCAPSECVYYDLGCGGCRDGTWVPTLIFFGVVTRGLRRRR